MHRAPPTPKPQNAKPQMSNHQPQTPQQVSSRVIKVNYELSSFFTLFVLIRM